MFVIGYQNPILKTWSTFFRKAKAVLQLLFKHLIGLWALDILHFWLDVETAKKELQNYFFFCSSLLLFYNNAMVWFYYYVDRLNKY
jgi:hypothetical protein